MAHKIKIWFISFVILIIISVSSYASYKSSSPIVINRFVINDVDKTGGGLRIEWAKYPKDENGILISSKCIITGKEFNDIVSTLNKAMFKKSSLSLNEIVSSGDYIDISSSKDSSTVLQVLENSVEWASKHEQFLLNEDASYMFAGTRFTTINTSGFDTSNTLNMSYMFYNMENLSSINVSDFDMKWCKDVSYMLAGLDLTTIDVSGWNTRNIESVAGLFSGDSSLTEVVGINTVTTRKITNMSKMFYGCSGLRSLNLSGFNTENVIRFDMMFSGTNCSVSYGEKFVPISIITSVMMFNQSTTSKPEWSSYGNWETDGSFVVIR